MKIIECPRDAMQGIESFIPTAEKIKYLNQLLKVGFDTIDFGSFVSPKAVPQMRDTAQVLGNLEIDRSKSKLLAIVANARGAKDALEFDEISYLGYPISISETFQVKNTNKTIAESFNILNDIQELCIEKNRSLVAYISMGFGNPYGDPYAQEIVLKFTDILRSLKIQIISLSDTIGVATADSIRKLYTRLTNEFTDLELGCHLHSRAETALKKIEAAYLAGCRRLDGCIRGYGGCPMAEDELTGNLPTELIIEVAEGLGEKIEIDREQFGKSLIMASNTLS
jgi:hydroxymethylglutaryl-CoA lyase